MRTARFNFHLFFGFGLLALASCSSGDDSAGFNPDDAGVDAKAKDATADTSVPKADAGADTSIPTADSSVPDTSIPVTDTGTPDTSVPVDAGTDVQTTNPDAGSSLIAKWSFEEGSGTTSADLSGLGHVATLMSTATFTASGKIGGGLLLDGNTAYADIASSLIDTTKPFTIASWVKFNAVNNWLTVLSQDDVRGGLFSLKVRGDDNKFDFDIETSDVDNPGFLVAQSSTTPVTGTWTHLAGVYDGASLILYVNGAAEATTTVPQPPLAATGHFVIGRALYNGAPGSFVNGTIDEVEVHNAALSAAEITALYNGQQSVDAGAPDSGTDSGLTDAGPDAATDAATDASADAGADASNDAAADSATDAAVTDAAVTDSSAADAADAGTD